MRYKLLIPVAIFSLISATFLISNAAVTIDQNAGTYTDDFANNTGLATRTRTSTDGALKLTNTSNVIAAPYVASGTAITNSIVPSKIAKWGTLSFTPTTPTGTAVMVQVMDGSNTLYSDSILPGNSMGFTATSVDLSALPIDLTAQDTGSTKFGQIRIRFTLTSNSTTTTPSVDSFNLTWTRTQGSLATSTLANTAWPISDGDAATTRNLDAEISYAVPKWTKSLGLDSPGYTLRGHGNTIYEKTEGGIVSWPQVTNGKIYSIDRRTGSTNWSREMSGFSFTSDWLALAEDETLYMNDIFNDVFVAYDGSNQGSVKWSDQYSTGHGNARANIGPDGTIYMVKTNSGDTTFTLYAYSANGTVRWASGDTPAGGAAPVGQVSIKDNKVYVPTKAKVYAYNTADGSLAWSYPTGSVGTLAVGSDGTIYAANQNSDAVTKKIFALNPDGSLKWEHSIGTSTDHWISLSLRQDGVLLGARTTAEYPAFGASIDAISTTNGALLWSTPIDTIANEYGMELVSDSLGGVISNSIMYLSTTTLNYHDADGNFKWALEFSTGNDLRMLRPSGDEDGNVYAALLDGTTYQSTLFQAVPWRITVSTNANAVNAGDAITITATSTMPQLDPFTSTPNKMQAVMGNGDKVTLDYSSTNAGGHTVWQGTYTIPSNASAGAFNFNVEAAATGLRTDTATNFASPLAGTGNTGLIKAASVTINAPAPQAPTGGGVASVFSNGNFVTLSPFNPLPANPPSETHSSSTPSNPPTASSTSNPSNPPISFQPPIGFANEIIRTLQQFLNQKGFLVALSGAGSPGRETDYFGPATSRALRLFQASSGSTFAEFTKNLKTGDTGPEVKQLQQLLNSRGFNVSNVGPGSPGKETDFFGRGTRTALLKLQKALSSKIPLEEQGELGEKTRELLNSWR